MHPNASASADKRGSAATTATGRHSEGDRPRAPKRTRLHEWTAARQHAASQPAGTSTTLRAPEPGASDKPKQPDVVIARPSWPDAVTLDDEAMKWARGRVHALVDDRYLLIAINADWVPRPVMGRVGIMLRDDGRFGVEDPLNWPQLYCPDRPYLALIPKRPPRHTPLAFLWETPRKEDFVSANEDPGGGAFGYLAPAKVAKLRDVVQSTRDSAGAIKRYSPAAHVAVAEVLNRLVAALHSSFTLFGIPSTFRNIVRLWSRFHRCWAECWAFIRWHNYSKAKADIAVLDKPTAVIAEAGVHDAGVIGTVTNDPTIAQRWLAAGVPVWFLVLRHAAGKDQFAGRDPVSLTDPSAIETSSRLVGGDVRCWATAGSQHVDAIWRESEGVLDIERNPLPADYSLENEFAGLPTLYNQGRSKQKATQRPRGTERFQATAHPLVPARLPAWQAGLEAVDTTQPCEARVGFWIPDPELVVTPSLPIRLLVHLSNWLSVRVGVFSKLGRRGMYHPVGPECWRIFLARFPEQTPEEREESQKKREAALAESASKASRKGGKRPDTHQAAQQKRADRKLQVCAYFGALLDRDARPFELRTPPISSFSWRGRTLALGLEDARAGRPPLPADVVCEVAWELSEVAFRVELSELDRCLTSNTGAGAYAERNQLLGEIFPGDHWSRPTLPPYPDRLPVQSPAERTLRLDALRRLLLRWPGCPRSFDMQLDDRTSGTTLDWFERAAARFYCSTAYLKWGRAAAVPRQPPVSLSAAVF
ncbi:hypothetical protein PsYK624_073220 [Phanerochaete sordida]|uniref:Uncharacterized protein n=1 Tax=Phanerochaete sordida TaxID=48140 RepID=A0A9P3G892_9APHY|nr:hypothetical protein PsYK624_073220 [Phanerochaete sordida]